MTSKITSSYGDRCLGHDLRYAWDNSVPSSDLVRDGQVCTVVLGMHNTLLEYVKTPPFNSKLIRYNLPPLA